ncbi:MAG: DUF2520 domain-containing protein [Polyangiales bacterium]
METRELHILGHGRMAVATRNTCAERFAAAVTHEGRALAGGAALRRGARAITLILAVPDRVLEGVAAAASPSLRAGDVVLHLAGMRGPDALDAARASGASLGSLHPLAAVSSPSERADLRDRAFVFEGDDDAHAEVLRMLGDAGATVHRASTVHRAGYHAAAALVATGAVALAQGASAMFSEVMSPAPSDRAQREMVASLLRSVADNVARDGAWAALASPLRRHDTGAVASHLDAMSPRPRVAAMYAAALEQVLDALEARRELPPEVLAAAREVVRARAG